MQTVKSTILERKLGFLQKVLNAGSKCVSGRLVGAMCDRVSSLCLVRECRELGEMCGVAFTDRLLKGELMWGKNLKEEIRRVDHAQLLNRCGLRAPLIVQVERQAGWARLWDAALDYGVSHTRGLQLVSRVLSHHGKGNHPCPLCDIAPLEDSMMGHLLANHCRELGLL